MLDLYIEAYIYEIVAELKLIFFVELKVQEQKAPKFLLIGNFGAFLTILLTMFNYYLKII